jgi:hypothetical protein
MAVAFPQPSWPDTLTERGPEEDRSILLDGRVGIGPTLHRLLAVRVDRDTLSVDFRADVDEDCYADYDLDVMLDELEFFDDIDAAGLLVLDTGNYVVWMVPWPKTER